MSYMAISGEFLYAHISAFYILGRNHKITAEKTMDEHTETARFTVVVIFWVSYIAAPGQCSILNI